MNKRWLLLIPIISLVGCGTFKVDESGQEIDNFLSSYSLKVSSNSDKLFFSTDISEEDYLNRGEAGIIKPGYLINVAHHEFTSYQDVNNPEFWYYKMSNDEDAEELPIESFSKTINQGESTLFYLQQIDFGMKIEEEGASKEYGISIESITFPEVNVFSLIFLGNKGYQERLSDGAEIAGDYILSRVRSNEETTLSFFIYLNGNDPLVTNENIEYINNNMNGTFDIRIKVEELIPE